MFFYVSSSPSSYSPPPPPPPHFISSRTSRGSVISLPLWFSPPLFLFSLFPLSSPCVVPRWRASKMVGLDEASIHQPVISSAMRGCLACPFFLPSSAIPFFPFELDFCIRIEREREWREILSHPCLATLVVPCLHSFIRLHYSDSFSRREHVGG